MWNLYLKWLTVHRWGRPPCGYSLACRFCVCSTQNIQDKEKTQFVVDTSFWLRLRSCPNIDWELCISISSHVIVTIAAYYVVAGVLHCGYGQHQNQWHSRGEPGERGDLWDYLLTEHTRKRTHFKWFSTLHLHQIPLWTTYAKTSVYAGTGWSASICMASLFKLFTPCFVLCHELHKNLSQKGQLDFQLLHAFLKNPLGLLRMRKTLGSFKISSLEIYFYSTSSNKTP